MSRAAAVSALAASALIALSSCTTVRSAPITSKAGVTTAPGPGQSLSTSPAASPLAASTHPKPLTEVFATAIPRNRAQAEVIVSWRESQVLWAQSEEMLQVAGEVTKYITASALADLRAAVSSFAETGWLPVGTDRLFNTQVTSITRNKAVVTSCDDGSAYNVADRTTGQTESPVPLAQQFLFVTFTMILGRTHWALASQQSVSYPNPLVLACMQDNRTHI